MKLDKPNKPHKRSTKLHSLSIRPKVLKAAKDKAKNTGRSFSGYVSFLIQNDCGVDA